MSEGNVFDRIKKGVPVWGENGLSRYEKINFSKKKGAFRSPTFGQELRRAYRGKGRGGCASWDWWGKIKKKPSERRRLVTELVREIDRQQRIRFSREQEAKYGDAARKMGRQVALRKEKGLLSGQEGGRLLLPSRNQKERKN